MSQFISPLKGEPSFADAVYTIESFNPDQRRQTLERERVPSTENEIMAFDREVARIRQAVPGEAYVVRLMCGDFEERREVIP